MLTWHVADHKSHNGSSYGHCFAADNTAAALYALVLNTYVKALWLQRTKKNLPHIHIHIRF